MPVSRFTVRGQPQWSPVCEFYSPDGAAQSTLGYVEVALPSSLMNIHRPVDVNWWINGIQSGRFRVYPRKVPLIAFPTLNDQSRPRRTAAIVKRTRVNPEPTQNRCGFDRNKSCYF